jgi:hypothetical protein
MPIHGLDVEAIDAYLKALDDPGLPLAEVTWINRRTAVIRAGMGPEHVISVQFNYHPGWKASVGGENRPVRADQAGLMVIEPGCDGACEIRLAYDGGRQLYLTLGCSLSVSLGALVWMLRRRR